jgi:CDP-diacylglycerol--glycerol-3-phosphate 3-phosphatidyltransferase
LLKIRIANLIPGTRILCSVVLLFCPAFSPPFYVLYFVAGLTDMIDGPVARKTGTVNKLGAKLDTAADFVFVAVCLWKLLPSLAVPLWLWIWIVLIALIKMINIISGYVIQKKYIALHTVMNKITGILLFLLPLMLPAVEVKYSTPLVCTVATFAAIQEGHYIRTGRDGNTVSATAL